MFSLSAFLMKDVRKKFTDADNILKVVPCSVILACLDRWPLPTKAIPTGEVAHCVIGQHLILATDGWLYGPMGDGEGTRTRYCHWRDKQETAVMK